MNDQELKITGVILAGGMARRMGGLDKGLLPVGDVPMASRIADALRPQVDYLLVNANRNAEEYQRLCACPVVADAIGDYAGPLAGMFSALQAAADNAILTVPCDSPLLAPDYRERMQTALLDNEAELAVAQGAGRMQPVFTLLRPGLLDSLRAFLEAGERKIDRWYAQHRVAQVDFSDRDAMFLNINTPQDRTEIEAHLRRPPVVLP